ncbi:MAG: hypothetical protein COA84_01720 [Robiginitomaculum sp.]|nr:MAG: hypothetical protein COA84_01720 [Robiginitomaculum sp.]
MHVSNFLGLAFTFCIVAGTAAAQSSSFDRNRNVSVSERPKPEYQTGGVDLGGFTLLPELTTGLRYNDNIFARRTATTDDFIFKVNPAAIIQSKWSRHSLRFNASVDHNEYLDVSSESITDYTVGSDARLDAGRGLSFGFGGEFQALNEPRTNSSTPTNTTKPIRYDLASVYGNVTREINRVRVALSSTLRDYNYKNGQIIGGGTSLQDDRDRQIVDVNGRFEYAVSPDTSVFFEAAYNDRSYDLQPPVVALDRDSDGYELLVGTNFDLTNLIRGEVSVGYLDQSFQSPFLPNINGFAVRANVEWFVTQLTTVTVKGSRSVEDSGIQGASGFLANKANFKIDHELLRNLVLTGQLTYGLDDFKGIDREDERFGGTFSGTVLLRRGVGLTFYYLYADQTSRGTAGGSDYTNNEVGFTIKFQR